MSSHHSFERGKDCVYKNAFHNSTVGRPPLSGGGADPAALRGGGPQWAPSSPHTLVPAFPQSLDATWKTWLRYTFISLPLLPSKFFLLFEVALVAQVINVRKAHFVSGSTSGVRNRVMWRAVAVDGVLREAISRYQHPNTNADENWDMRSIQEMYK